MRYQCTSRRRGISMIETVVVVALIAVLTATSLVTLNRRSGASDATAARASLVHVLRLQAATPGAPNADTAALQSLDPTRVYSSGGSSDPTTVSVMIDPDRTSRLIVAVFDGNDCWAVAHDYQALDDSSLEVWVVKKSAAACSANSMLPNLVPDETSIRGRTADKPLIV